MGGKVHLSMNSMTAETLSVMALSSFSSFQWLRDACFLSHQSETFLLSVYVRLLNDWIRLTFQTDLQEKSREFEK